ncbi:hypothetical protein Z951_26010 [Streptomyces sp. PRh5]|nr:hypothetical protein Z951_26010 [Streptomyces sp. PRh5]
MSHARGSTGQGPGHDRPGPAGRSTADRELPVHGSPSAGGARRPVDRRSPALGGPSAPAPGGPCGPGRRTPFVPGDNTSPCALGLRASGGVRPAPR